MAKYAHDTIVPFKGSNETKKQQVASMFDKIAFRYDFLNRFLSAGIDIGWRKKAIKELLTLQPSQVLDVATGTGDMAVLTQKILKPARVTGIDISAGMLQIGQKKIENLGLQNVIKLEEGDSETIGFPDNTFDAITVAFGVRNFQNLEQGLAEMLRVLKPEGKLVVLEFSRPKQFLFKGIYNLYMKTIAPAIGKLVAKNKDAYQYLNDSVQRFPEGSDFTEILAKVGYTGCYDKILTLGICSIYVGSKK
jgi:demethylmenaquinone methyltransferase/2-methoxy-6-polyprenyl-1,4-benzoquinol methylase